jgi:hypothetical protein
LLQGRLYGKEVRKQQADAKELNAAIAANLG